MESLPSGGCRQILPETAHRYVQIPDSLEEARVSYLRARVSGLRTCAATKEIHAAAILPARSAAQLRDRTTGVINRESLVLDWKDRPALIEWRRDFLQSIRIFEPFTLRALASRLAEY